MRKHVCFHQQVLFRQNGFSFPRLKCFSMVSLTLRHSSIPSSLFYPSPSQLASFYIWIMSHHLPSSCFTSAYISGTLCLNFWTFSLWLFSWDALASLKLSRRWQSTGSRHCGPVPYCVCAPLLLFLKLVLETMANPHVFVSSILDTQNPKFLSKRCWEHDEWNACERYSNASEYNAHAIMSFCAMNTEKS